MSLLLIHHNPELAKDPKRRLVAYTRSGWPITVPRFAFADRIPSNTTAGLVAIRTTALIESMEANKKTNLEARSKSEAQYNCVGMIFCSRTEIVDIKHIYDILKHDGYNRIGRLHLAAGDLVLYIDKDKHEPSHIALVSSVSSIDLRVLSKWGKDGEVVHDFRQVPDNLGVPTAFYSTRVSHVTE